MRGAALGALAGLAALAACAGPSVVYGRDFPAELVGLVVKGKTRDADLLRMFGEPFARVRASRREEVWRWTYIVKGGREQRKSLAVFLKDGVVVNDSYANSADPAAAELAGRSAR